MAASRRDGFDWGFPELLSQVSRVVKQTDRETIVVHEFRFLAVPGAVAYGTRLVTRAFPGSAQYFQFDCATGHLEVKWLHDPAAPEESAISAGSLDPRERELVSKAVSDRHTIGRKVWGMVNKDPHVLADVTQETVLRAIEHPDEKKIENAEAYLVGAAKRIALEMRRKRARLGPSLDERQASLEPAAKGGSPGDDLAAQEGVSLARAAIARLDRRRREAVVLVATCKLTHAEAATLVGTSEAVMRDALRHARTALRRVLDREP